MGLLAVGLVMLFLRSLLCFPFSLPPLLVLLVILTLGPTQVMKLNKTGGMMSVLFDYFMISPKTQQRFK